jgi:PAS domain S-box-containing protein
VRAERQRASTKQSASRRRGIRRRPSPGAGLVFRSANVTRSGEGAYGLGSQRPAGASLNGRKIPGDGERAELILLAIEDVTEHNNADAALRESEERYRTLFDLGPVAVYSCDASGVIQQFNRRAAELWGREPAVEDTEERFCGSFKMFRPDGSFMPHEQCPMAEVVSDKLAEVRGGEVHIERPDGTSVTVVENIRPLKDGRGRVTGAINCFYDITGPCALARVAR